MTEPGIPGPGDSPEEWLREALRRMLEGSEGIDPMELARAAGFEGDPEELLKMVTQATQGMGQALLGGEKAAVDHAVSIARSGALDIAPDRAEHLTGLINLAGLWLGEVTTMAPPESTPTILGRPDWARATLPVWQEMAEPVSDALARALGDLMAEHAPEEMAELLSQSRPMLTTLATSLFRLQLAQVVGNLSREVLTAGEIGIPMLPARSEGDVAAGVLAQNVDEFAEGLGVARDEVDLYVIVRELAHQRLFRHARWLRAHVMALIGDYARGMRIDGDRLMELAEDIDPTKPEEIQRLLSSGALLPERTEAQQRALERLETMLALIDGWVDHVTTRATTRLPKADSVAEAIRRRRATGGPAEHAFKTLVGLELRPRRLREASALWSQIADQLGPDGRDELWSHPDVLPTEEDLTNPANFLQRLAGSTTDQDAVDRFLDDVFGDDSPAEPDPDSPAPDQV